MRESKHILNESFLYVPPTGPAGCVENLVDSLCKEKGKLLFQTELLRRRDVDQQGRKKGHFSAEKKHH